MDLLQTFERLPMPLLRPLEVTAQLRLQRSARGGHFLGGYPKLCHANIYIYTHIYIHMKNHGFDVIYPLVICYIAMEAMAH